MLIYLFFCTEVFAVENSASLVCNSHSQRSRVPVYVCARAHVHCTQMFFFYLSVPLSHSALTSFSLLRFCVVSLFLFVFCLRSRGE